MGAKYDIFLDELRFNDVEDAVKQTLKAAEHQDSVKDFISVPPLANEGDRYLVKSTGTGAWTGKDNQIAQFSSGTWEFTLPKEGFTVIADSKPGSMFIFNSGIWVEKGIEDSFGKVFFVDSVNGNDATAKKGSQYFMFKTIKAAQALATSSDLVYVMPGTYNENELSNIPIYLTKNAKIDYNNVTTTSPNPDNEVFPNGVNVYGEGEIIANYNNQAPVNWFIRCPTSSNNVMIVDKFQTINQRNIRMDSFAKLDIKARELMFGTYSYVFANNISNDVELNIDCQTFDTSNTHDTFGGNNNYKVRFKAQKVRTTGLTVGVWARPAGSQFVDFYFEIQEFINDGTNGICQLNELSTTKMTFKLGKYTGNRMCEGLGSGNLDVFCQEAIVDEHCFKFTPGLGGGRIKAIGNFKSLTTPCIELSGSSVSINKMELNGELIANANEVIKSIQGSGTMTISSELRIKGRIESNLNSASGHGIVFENNANEINKIILDNAHIVLNHASAKSVDAPIAKNIHVYNALSNRNKNANITELINTIQVDSNVI